MSRNYPLTPRRLPATRSQLFAEEGTMNDGPSSFTVQPMHPIEIYTGVRNAFIAEGLVYHQGTRFFVKIDD